MAKCDVGLLVFLISFETFIQESISQFSDPRFRESPIEDPRFRQSSPDPPLYFQSEPSDPRFRQSEPKDQRFRHPQPNNNPRFHPSDPNTFHQSQPPDSRNRQPQNENNRFQQSKHGDPRFRPNNELDPRFRPNELDPRFRNNNVDPRYRPPEPENPRHRQHELQKPRHRQPELEHPRHRQPELERPRHRQPELENSRFQQQRDGQRYEEPDEIEALFRDPELEDPDIRPSKPKKKRPRPSSQSKHSRFPDSTNPKYRPNEDNRLPYSEGSEPYASNGSRGRPPPKNVDPCDDNAHRFIKDQPQRSYNYRLGSTASTQNEAVLCDRDLIPGWYRFKSLAGDTIPTSCPGINYCGTRAPVWMKGSLPTVEEGITKVHGCVSVQGKCCTTQIPMMVKNCTDFIVYRLEPTPACPSAYCAGYEVPCPVGLSSESGYTPCHFPVELLETKVSYGLSKDLSQIQFFCDVTLGGNVVPESVALEVEWLADEETVQSETFGLVQHQKGVLKEDKWSVGQILQCRARAKHTSINTFTALVTSPPFNTGILILNPPAITVNEGGDPGYIEFQLSSPITCPPKEKKKKSSKGEKKRVKRKDEEQEEEQPEEDGCCLTLEIATRGANTPRCPDGSQFDLVVLNSCTYKLCSDEWNTTHRIPVWAVNDGLTGGKESGGNDPSTVFVDIRAVDPSPPRWQDFALPSQEIIVTHADVEEKCLMDDTTTTFDGLNYVNRLEGIFILYKHETFPYEVQIQLKKCNQRIICNCAVAIRFGEAMLAADICTTGKLRLWSYTAEGGYIEPSKIAHLPQIVRIDDGRSFQIQFPSGTRVSIGPNLRFIKIQASLSDVERTLGLCGSFDRDQSNDLSTYKGSVACSRINNSTVQKSCDEFSKGWRLLPEHSLFQGAFSNDGPEGEEHGDDTLNPGHCSCSELKKTQAIDLHPKQKSKFSSYPYDEYQTEEPQEEEQESKDKCTSRQCVDPRGVELSHQLLELLLDEDFLPEDDNFGKIQESAAILQPAFGGSKNPVLAQESTKTKWKDAEAEVFCLRMIEGVPTAKLCRDSANIDVDIYTTACKNEVLHTKSAIWAIDALEQLRWECREQVYHNRSIWEPQLGRQHGTPPLGVLSSLCLNNCTGVGSCQNGVCHCNVGFSSSDCSINVNQGPKATYINNRGVCDLRNKPCSEVIVWGDGFADAGNIKCHFDVYRTVTVKSVPVLSGTITTNGKLLTYESIICDIPELPIHDAKIASFYIPGEGIDKTRTLMRLWVSYGVHGTRSSSLDFAIYDSLCWSCEGPLKCTPTPSQSCNVLSEPFGGNTDPFQQNSPFSESSFSPTSIPLQLPDLLEFNRPPQASILHPSLSTTCALLKDSGPCKNDIVRYYFDGGTQKCKPFIFGGCQGNANNFASEETCTSECLKSSEKEPGILSSSSDGQYVKSPEFEISKIEQLPVKCIRKPDGNSCRDPEIIQYFYDYHERKCRPTVSCVSDGLPDRSTCEVECENVDHRRN